MIDVLAQRYGCLPTTVLSTASDWDVRVALVSQRWHHDREQEAQTGKKKVDVPDVNTLQEMINKVRNRQWPAD
jgi:hypothetical protein